MGDTFLTSLRRTCSLLYLFRSIHLVSLFSLRKIDKRLFFPSLEVSSNSMHLSCHFTSIHVSRCEQGAYHSPLGSHLPQEHEISPSLVIELPTFLSFYPDICIHPRKYSHGPSDQNHSP